MILSNPRRFSLKNNGTPGEQFRNIRRGGFILHHRGSFWVFSGCGIQTFHKETPWCGRTHITLKLSKAR
jgi:hypothetical protein